jgi:hypothetical protein
VTFLENERGKIVEKTKEGRKRSRRVKGLEGLIST